MTTSRKNLINLEVTRYYHCISRCVRRSFLYGIDSISGHDYSHRKPKILNKLKLLASAFTIDICAFAIMSNHIHLVLHVDIEKAKSLTKNEVIERWGVMFPKSQAKLKMAIENKVPIEITDKIIELWRSRLQDISWFMRNLNQDLARDFNLEDNCKGRFWEGRFKSQMLLKQHY